MAVKLTRSASGAPSCESARMVVIAVLRRGGQGPVEVGARFQEGVWLCPDSV